LDLSFWAILAINLSAAMSGAFFRPGDWYAELRKPWWRPPNAAFPIVWTTLYILLTFATWRVWTRASGDEAVMAMTAFGVQLVFNAAWSAIFFGMRRMRLALVELVCLWLSIAAMILIYQRTDIWAAALLLPYITWVTIAGVLNWTMIRLNPTAGPSPASSP